MGSDSQRLDCYNIWPNIGDLTRIILLFHVEIVTWDSLVISLTDYDIRSYSHCLSSSDIKWRSNKKILSIILCKNTLVGLIKKSRCFISESWELEFLSSKSLFEFGNFILGQFSLELYNLISVFPTENFPTILTTPFNWPYTKICH